MSIKKKIKTLALKGGKSAVVTMLVITFLLLGNVFSVRAEISSETLERIKTGLNILDFAQFANYSNEELKNALELGLGVAEDVSANYWMLILSSMNEVDFMDSILSQRYKSDFYDYFDGIIKEKINLLSHWRGISKDLGKIMDNRAAATNPFFLLTLNSFEITDKVVDIFLAFNALEDLKTYNGLWLYFDYRRNNETHEFAWDQAQLTMGWVADSLGGLYKERDRQKEIFQLESQFQDLWDKWEPYIDSGGIKEEFKEENKAELRRIFAEALELSRVSEQNKQSAAEGSLFGKVGKLLIGVKTSAGNVVGGITDGIWSATNSVLTKIRLLLSRTNLFGASLISGIDNNIDGGIGEGGLGLGPELNLTELENNIDNILEEVGSGVQELSDQVGEPVVPVDGGLGVELEVFSTTTEEVSEDVELEEGNNQQNEQDISAGDIAEPAEDVVIFCERNRASLPRREKIIINEVAWMGTENSASDEWIELRNMWGIPADISGWQFLDKDNQIKIVFKEGSIIPAGGFYLLERTDDNSVPDVPADVIYSGAVNDTNEALYIYDKDCRLEDEVTAFPDWQAGDKAERRSMERLDDIYWYDYQGIGNNGILGTPKVENSPPPADFFGGVAVAAKEEQPYFPPDILISEVQILGDETIYDFIELFNQGEKSADISGFQLKKKSSSGTEYSVRLFPEGTVIPAKGYFIWANSDYSASGLILADNISTQTLAENNSVVILDKNKSVIDSVAWGAGTNQFFESSPFLNNPGKNQSIGRRWSTTTQSYIDTYNNQDDFEIGIPSPGGENKAQAVSAEELPLAIFSYLPENPKVSEEIIFDASLSTSTGGLISFFSWDFGGGHIFNTDKPTTTYQYLDPGEFSVVLVVTDSNGATSSPATKAIAIVEKDGEVTQEDSRQVVISEIAWMGTKANAFDEWLELYVNSDVTLDGWKIFGIKDGTTTLEISLSGAAASSSYLLLERTDDNAVADIKADFIFSGGLNNDGMRLELRNEKGVIIDVVDCSGGWFAGDNTTKQTMERISSNATGSDAVNWANNNKIIKNGKDADGGVVYGTPQSENSISKMQTEISGTLKEDLTLTFLGSPYFIKSSLIIPKGITLTIEPGVILKFFMPESQGINEGAYLEVRGSLRAVGEEGKEIIFTSINSRWPGMRFISDNLESEKEITSELVHVRVDNAMSWDLLVYSAIKVDKKAILLKDSVVEPYSNVRGLHLINSYSVIDGVSFSGFTGEKDPSSAEYPSAIFVNGGAPTIKNCVFSGNYYGITLKSSETCINNSNYIIFSNTFSDNYYPIYEISPGFPCFSQNQVLNPQKDKYGDIIDGVVVNTGLTKETVWQADLPYIVSRSIYVQATTTMNPGVVVKFKSGNLAEYIGGMEIKTGGNLIALGTEEKPILFTSANESPSPGIWKNIWFRKPSGAGSLDWVKIEYGGYPNVSSLRIDPQVAGNVNIGANVVVVE